MRLCLRPNPWSKCSWDAACSIRGEKDAAKFKDYLLPLLFLKRLSDVFDDEIERLVEEYGERDIALEIAESDHALLRFLPAPGSALGRHQQSRKLRVADSTTKGAARSRGTSASI